ncbi:MAG: hypothetical protein C4560_06790 [Nitrospiraceae bacterium]|nr:MAG: hypothetical protein C4560_06790 [Nitrospiraceae bacterium]
MGREHVGKRQYFQLCSAGLIFFIFFGCATLGKINDRQAAEEHLKRGSQLLAEGDYQGALRENHRAFSLSPKAPPGDNSLFNMGLIYAHYGNPDKDYKKALGYFEQLIREQPRSPMLENAKIWVGVINDINNSKKEAAPVNEHLLRGQQLIEAGDFRGAFNEIQKVLAVKGPARDTALFYMGLFFAHYGNPEKDYAKSIGYLGQLIREYPQSPWLEQAKIMVDVINVIEKAKQIDIEIERKKKELAR